jgi:hypothetical protein
LPFSSLKISPELRHPDRLSTSAHHLADLSRRGDRTVSLQSLESYSFHIIWLSVCVVAVDSACKAAHRATTDGEELHFRGIPSFPSNSHSASVQAESAAQRLVRVEYPIAVGTLLLLSWLSCKDAKPRCTHSRRALASPPDSASTKASSCRYVLNPTEQRQAKLVFTLVCRSNHSW